MSFLSTGGDPIAALFDPANPRFKGKIRPYTEADVRKLRPGGLHIEHSLARHGAERLERQFAEMPYVNTMGALTGNQAMQYVRAGLNAIYLSGWQVAADANLGGFMYPDQSLYDASSVPAVVRRINRALQRCAEIDCSEGKTGFDWFAPIVADAEAGFGGQLNAFELMKQMIEAGAAGVHFEDQLAAEKKCGHLGGKVLVAASYFLQTLIAARLAADVMGVPTYIIARTDAESATLHNPFFDEDEERFLDKSEGQTRDGFWRIKKGNGIDQCIHRALKYAPYADLIWMETGTPDLEVAARFAEAVRREFPNQMLAYNCSPSFHWRKHLDDATIAKFQNELGAMGYKFQFITLAGFHNLNHGAHSMARGYAERQMAAYVELQDREFADVKNGFTAVKHQHEVGTGYFDLVRSIISPDNETGAMAHSTEVTHGFDGVQANAK